MPPPRLAKLTGPRSDALLPRPRLFALLDTVREAPMIWLGAAPGAGKTSLIASYLAKSLRALVWFQVDAGDSDPATFFHYLTLAMAALGRDVSPLPVFATGDADQPLNFARRYLRGWWSLLPQDGALVLDNLQEAGDAPVWHAMLATLLDETPPGMQVFALSRAGPPAELARARLARRLHLLEWADLRLHRDEARQLAVQSELRIDDDSAAVFDHVFEQSQGWVAGLILLIERVKQSGAPQREAFAGSLEAVFEYFAGQVFNATSPQTQDTLLRLSFLPQMNADTAATVSGNPQVGDLLEDWSRRNLFIDRRWSETLSYQFHALFRAFLQSRARLRLGDDPYRACAALAARVLHETGQVDDAVRLYLGTSHWSAAAALILAQAELLVRSGRHQTLREWIEALPPSHREGQHWLVYWHGVSLTGQDPSASREMIERALAGFDEDGERGGQVRATASLVAGWWAERTSLQWMEPHVRRLNALLTIDSDLDLRTRAIGLIGLARARLMIRPDDPLLADYSRRLAAMPTEQLSPELVVGIGTCLLAYYWGIGDSEAGTTIARRTHAAALSAEVPISDRLWFWFYLMTHRVYLADVEGAREMLQRARALNDESRQSPPLADFIRWDVTLELQLAQPERARQMLERDLLPVLSDASLSTQACIDLEQARVGIEEGRIEEAMGHAQRGFTLCEEGGLGWLRASLGLTLVCAQALAGRCDAADETLQRLRRHIGGNLPILSGSIEAYQALVHLQAGRLDEARIALARAFELRRITNYPWGPGWNRPGIALLAAFALREGMHVAPMQHIVRRLRIAPPSPDIEHWPWAVRIRVLDGFSLSFDGQASSAAAGKAPHRLLALLKALAASGAQSVPADELADRVWPDADGDHARRSLDTGLSRLRKLLRDESAILMHDGKVSLNGNCVDLDLRSFEYQCERVAQSAQGSAQWMQAATRVVELYRRPLLSGEAEEAWLLPLRASARKRWRDVADGLVAALSDAGQAAAARRLQARIAQSESA